MLCNRLKAAISFFPWQMLSLYATLYTCKTRPGWGCLPHCERRVLPRRRPKWHAMNFFVFLVVCWVQQGVSAKGTWGVYTHILVQISMLKPLKHNFFLQIYERIDDSHLQIQFKTPRGLRFSRGCPTCEPLPCKSPRDPRMMEAVVFFGVNDWWKVSLVSYAWLMPYAAGPRHSYFTKKMTQLGINVSACHTQHGIRYMAFWPLGASGFPSHGWENICPEAPLSPPTPLTPPPQSGTPSKYLHGLGRNC